VPCALPFRFRNKEAFHRFKSLWRWYQLRLHHLDCGTPPTLGARDATPSGLRVAGADVVAQAPDRCEQCACCGAGFPGDTGIACILLDTLPCQNRCRGRSLRLPTVETATASSPN